MSEGNGSRDTVRTRPPTRQCTWCTNWLPYTEHVDVKFVKSANATLRTTNGSTNSHNNEASTLSMFKIANMVRIATSSICMLTASVLAVKHSHPIAKRNDVETVAAPTSDDVQTALEEWEIDVNKVNAFLDGASGNLNNLASFASDAQDAASNFAMEKPKQLQALIKFVRQRSKQ